MTPITHTKGPYKLQGRHIYHLLFEEPLRGCNLIASVPDENPESLVNASLMTRFNEVPHTCTDPTCPGMVNQRKLEAFEEIKAFADKSDGAFLGQQIALLHRVCKALATTEGK